MGSSKSIDERDDDPVTKSNLKILETFMRTGFKSGIFDFDPIQLKFKKSFYGDDGDETFRTQMNIDQLDIGNEEWIRNYLKMENGLIEFTIPKTGKYQIIQQSRSSNFDRNERKGPAMGVNIRLKMNLKQVSNIYFKNNNN